MIIYLVCGGEASGTSWEQVAEEVAHLNTLGGPHVRLVALVAARVYSKARKRIRIHDQDALVLPTVSGRTVVKVLCRLLNPSGIVAIGEQAAQLALHAKKSGRVVKVGLDARVMHGMGDGQGADPIAQGVDLWILENEEQLLEWQGRRGHAKDHHVLIPWLSGQEQRQGMLQGSADDGIESGLRRLLRCMGPSRVHQRERRSGRGNQVKIPPGCMVSIVVPSYNKGRYLHEMVASVQAQTHRDWELLFIDDRSTDDTRALIANLAGADERIKLHFQQENKGANHCRSLGMQLAAGSHMMFLDADDVLAPDCLARRLALDPSGEFDFVVTTMGVFRQRTGEGGGYWIPSTVDPLGSFLQHRIAWTVMQVLWRSAFLRGVGGWDRAFHRLQDVEFHTRVLFRPCIRYLTVEGEPDCFYRIDEGRKTSRPYALLEAFIGGALLFCEKFKEEAKARGMERLLMGTIYRINLHISYNRKIGAISAEEARILRNQLVNPQIAREMGVVKRMVMWLSDAYNVLPIRIPGVNWVLSRWMAG